MAALRAMVPPGALPDTPLPDAPRNAHEGGMDRRPLDDAALFSTTCLDRVYAHLHHDYTCLGYPVPEQLAPARRRMMQAKRPLTNSFDYRTPLEREPP